MSILAPLSCLSVPTGHKRSHGTRKCAGGGEAGDCIPVWWLVDVVAARKRRLASPLGQLFINPVLGFLIVVQGNHTRSGVSQQRCQHAYMQMVNNQF